MAIQSAEEFVSIMWQCAEHDAPRAEWLRHITARDAAISAEVYEDAAKIADRFAHDSGARVIAGEIRTRAQPVPAPERRKGGAEHANLPDWVGQVEAFGPMAERAGDEVMQSREAMLRKLDAERAKETGGE